MTHTISQENHSNSNAQMHTHNILEYKPHEHHARTQVRSGSSPNGPFTELPSNTVSLNYKPLKSALFSKCVATCNEQENNQISCPRCPPDDAYDVCQWNPSDRSQGGVCNYGCAFLILDPLDYLCNPMRITCVRLRTSTHVKRPLLHPHVPGVPGVDYFNSVNIYGGMRPSFCSGSGMACKKGCEYAIDVMNSPGQASGQTSTYEVIAPQVGVSNSDTYRIIQGSRKQRERRSFQHICMDVRSVRALVFEFSSQSSVILYLATP